LAPDPEPGEDREADQSFDTELITDPLLGAKAPAEHRRTLTVLLVLAVVVLAAIIFYVLSQTEKLSQQVAASGQALMQSQRLAKSASQALVGSPSAFPEVRESSDVLVGTMKGFVEGSDAMSIKA